MTTIICIDDDHAHAKKISDALTQVGHQVLVSNTAREGLSMILKHSPNLVLYNIANHNEDRHLILSSVRDKYPLLAETPFIFLSAHSDDTQILSDLKAGADTYLTKPINLQLLLATVQACLRQVKRIKYRHEQLLVLDI